MYTNGNTVYESKLPARLYHYCNTDAFLNIMQESSFRLSNITKSNDKEEIIHIQPKICRVLDKLIKNTPEYIDGHITAENINNLVDNCFNDFSKNLYVVCFSEDSDLLSNWEMYADKGKGVAIGINPNLLDNLLSKFSSALMFDKISYNENIEEKTEKYLISLVAEHKGKFDLSSMEDIIYKTVIYISQYAAFYKNSKFSSEKEWRLIFNPLNNINRLKNYEEYLEKIIEFEQYKTIGDENFFIGKLNFKVGANKNAIASFYSLSFEKIKTSFIREIIIGPNMKLSPYDLDLRLLLYKCGYEFSLQKSANSVLIKKSAVPYQSF